MIHFDCNTLKKIACKGDKQTDRQTDVATTRPHGPVGRFGEKYLMSELFPLKIGSKWSIGLEETTVGYIGSVKYMKPCIRL